ncbi:hypothetical protein AB7828_10040 [Tardiphaga sp. 215_C5_N2_1]|uniref:hypothetical protein n=1 Tax=Tardiphaga sp. 215_C5_N2_1 TaxID=3240774 RepID=UPI003F89AC87
MKRLLVFTTLFPPLVLFVYIAAGCRAMVFPTSGSWRGWWELRMCSPSFLLG